MDLNSLARAIRLSVLRMTHRARTSHVGSCFSIADILAVVYGRVLRIDPANPKDPSRDRLVLSKGHAGAAVFAALAELKFFDAAWLDDYCQGGSRLQGHISSEVPGVEASTGSLGHGLPIATGMALAGRGIYRSFCILSDGECDEGSTWEAALLAPAHRLDNLIAIIDYNKWQSIGTTREVLDLEPFADKWRSFGWAVQELDGHDMEALTRAFEAIPLISGKPSCFICHTTKGKGVSFMEDQLKWHYFSCDADEYAIAREELEAR